DQGRGQRDHKAAHHEMLCQHVNKMSWDVLDVSAASHALLTSDRPVVISMLKDPQMGSIMMPISPTKLFVAGNDGRWLNYLKGRRPRDIVGPANRQTVERARRFVWARDKSQEVF